MFRLRSSAPIEASSRLLAGFLAGIAGFVNSAGFVSLGAFTSHVTGNVGRLAEDVVTADASAGFIAAAWVLAFFTGALFANLLVESALLAHRETAVAAVLVVEATMLGVFAATARLGFLARADLGAGVLCAAMGMQNSLITRLSGATVRTTHLTGVMTDLGIETAAWVRWRADRWRVMRRAGATVAVRERPNVHKLTLLLTIASAFTLGAIGGAAAGLRWHRHAMGLPAACLLARAAYALHTVRTQRTR